MNGMNSISFPPKGIIFHKELKKDSSCWLNHPCDIFLSLKWIIFHSFALKVGGGEKCQKVCEPSNIQHLYIYIVFSCLEASWETDLLWGSLMNGLIATPISLDFLKNHRISIPNSNVFKLHDCDTTNIILHSTMPPTISPNINSIIALNQKTAKSFANTCDSNHKSLQQISWVLSPPTSQLLSKDKAEPCLGKDFDGTSNC